MTKEDEIEAAEEVDGRSEVTEWDVEGEKKNEKEIWKWPCAAQAAGVRSRCDWFWAIACDLAKVKCEVNGA